MKQSDSIIVLHYTRFSEKAVILHTLSRHYGRRSFLAGNAMRTLNLFQPLSILECVVSENPKSSLFRAGDFAQAPPLQGIRNSIGKNAVSIFVAEVLFRALREGPVETGFFEWCRNEILALDTLTGGYANFHVRFLLDFAAASGFCPDAAALLPFAGDCTPLAVRLSEAGYAESMLVPMSGRQRSELCASILKYLEAHLETPLKIRSLDILAELWSSI